MLDPQLTIARPKALQIDSSRSVSTSFADVHSPRRSSPRLPPIQRSTNFTHELLVRLRAHEFLVACFPPRHASKQCPTSQKRNPTCNVLGCAGSLSLVGDRKAHKLFQHKVFGPHPKHPILGPQKKLKGRKKRTHMHFFGGILGGQKGVPNELFSATKSLVSCFFPALKGF